MRIRNTRVSEPTCFGTAPGIFNPEPAPAPGKREQKFVFFQTDYDLSKIRSNTCTSSVAEPEPVGAGTFCSEPEPV